MTESLVVADQANGPITELAGAAGRAFAPAAPAPLVSVLMSTYAGETAANLAECLESLRSQSVMPDQLVLVVDGPIGDDQEEVISRFSHVAPFPQLTLLRLPASRGLAGAMNAGLDLCTGTYTMRMDSDDLCVKDRVELQLAFATSHPDVDVVSSWSEEFFADGASAQIKVSPVSHDEIVRALRWRNILVHPTVLVKTETLRRISGYRTKFGKLEDYDLFVRLAQSGARFHVIPKVLVRVRSSIEQRGRRGGWRYAFSEVRFRAECLRSGFLNVREFMLVTTMYVVFRLGSGALRRRLYGLALT